MKPIAVVGSYNAGLTMAVDHLPMAGETVIGTGYSEGPGGKGSNQAIAAARLGAKVSFVGCVGKDRYGGDALRLWKKEGVDARFVTRSRSHTGLGFVVVDTEGGNTISIDPGANLDLTVEDVYRARGAISGSGVLLLQLETPLESTLAAAKVASTGGAKVVLNPAPAVGLDRLDLSEVDIVTPNEHEFVRMSGTDDFEAGARRILSKGVSAVVVTLGERGARVMTRKGGYAVEAPKVQAVDTTGAGDAFNGALGVALSEGRELWEAVNFANCAGALCVTKREVVPSLPTRGAVQHLERKTRPARP